MVTANILINQAGRPAGQPGVSRDDLLLNVPVTLSNDNNSGVVAWNWHLLSKPPGSLAGLSTPTASSCQFTPDVAGSYLVQLLLNGRERATSVAAVRTAFLNLRIPAKDETDELGGWDAAFQTALADLEAGIESGGVSGSDRNLVFSDDTQLAEAGNVFVTKKTFRIVRDPNRPPSTWRVVVSLWCDASYDTTECRIQVGDVTVDSLTLPSVFGSTETTVAGTITINGANEPAGVPLTFSIQLRLVEGGVSAANIQYTDVYAVYG